MYFQGTILICQIVCFLVETKTSLSRRQQLLKEFNKKVFYNRHVTYYACHVSCLLLYGSKLPCQMFQMCF